MTPPDTGRFSAARGGSRTTKTRVGLCTAAAVLAGAIAARAQDTQYWNQQYGTRAELLGGAVVGSFLDLSATYYNPGAMIMTENPDVLLSANAFEHISTKLETPGIGIEDPSAASFGPAPTLFAGLLPKKWAPGRLAYSALTRQQYNVRILSRASSSGAFLPDPGPEDYSTEFMFDQRMSENWFGLTWSKRVRGNTGFGVTMYGAYRGQRTRVESISAAGTGAGTVNSLIYIDEFDYWSLRMIWKLGLAFERGPATLGLVLTTPSVGLFGGGSMRYTRSVAGMDLDGDGMRDDVFASGVEKGLDAEYRSPVSVSAGSSYQWRRATFHVSAEWFDGVDSYDVIEGGVVPEILPGSTVARRVSHELASVFNVGAGVEYGFSEYWTGFGAFTSDRSAAVQDTETWLSASTWDIYHVTFGTALETKSLDLTLGLRYSFGSEDLGEHRLSRTSIPLPGAEVTYRSWKGILGFALRI